MNTPVAATPVHVVRFCIVLPSLTGGQVNCVLTWSIGVTEGSLCTYFWYAHGECHLRSQEIGSGSGRIH